MPSAIAYVEPSLASLLTLGSFLTLANVARFLLDRILNAGFLGEIAVGVIFGSPLTGILLNDWQQTFLVLGYIGLLLIVFEGGLSTPQQYVFKSLPLASAVALTGILFPIGVSMCLMTPGFSYPILESFASGAALSATSLGTTFVVIRSTGSHLNMESTRVGAVLITAAVIDDVVGFVMSTIIRELGTSSSSVSSIDPWSIAQPIVTSILFLVLAVPFNKYILQPAYRRLLHPRLSRLGQDRTCFVLIVLGLSAGVSVTYVIKSSPLLGAYMAGLFIAALPPPPLSPSTDSRSITRTSSSSPPPLDFISLHTFPLRKTPGRFAEPPIDPHPQLTDDTHSSTNVFKQSYELFFGPLQLYLLSPIFFASIGMSIPFVSLWTGQVIWRGVLYGLLMILCKMVCGLWILIWDAYERSRVQKKRKRQVVQEEEGAVAARVEKPEPLSFFPALFLGLAMVPRGEIGLIIAQTGYNQSGLLTEEGFLVVLWAISLATILGPVMVGILVRKAGSRVSQGRWA